MLALVTALQRTISSRSSLDYCFPDVPSGTCTLLHGLTMSLTAPSSLAWTSSSASIVRCSHLRSSDPANPQLTVKIPPRVMFLTQIYGTVLGGFINYAVMISIVAGNKELLADSNGDASWSGATIQSYNTNASTWALAAYLYKQGAAYSIVPFGLLIGAAIVVAHRITVQVCIRFLFPITVFDRHLIIHQFVPKIGNFNLREINFPTFLQFAGYIPYNQSQTCVILSWTIVGFYTQFYLRNYRPRLFKDYSYLIAGAFDGASLTCLFILSFAVFGAGGPATPFPKWWGNNSDGNYDLCPVVG
jgi:hypothetical protein